MERLLAAAILVALAAAWSPAPAPAATPGPLAGAPAPVGPLQKDPLLSAVGPGVSDFGRSMTSTSMSWR